MNICPLAPLFPVLFFTSPWLLCNCQFVVPIPFTIFMLSSNPSLIWKLSKHSLHLLFCFCSAWLFILVFKFKFFIVVQLQFSHLFPRCSLLPYSPTTPTVNAPPHCPCPWVLYLCSFACPFPFFPCYPPATPLWSLWVCFLFPNLWFYFAHLFVLLITFHL